MRIFILFCIGLLNAGYSFSNDVVNDPDSLLSIYYDDWMIYMEPNRKTPPYITFGDFDGDGNEDVAKLVNYDNELRLVITFKSGDELMLSQKDFSQKLGRNYKISFALETVASDDELVRVVESEHGIKISYDSIGLVKFEASYAVVCIYENEAIIEWLD